MKTKALKYLFLTKSIGLYLNVVSLFSSKFAAEKSYKIFCKPRKGKIKPEKFPEVLKAPTKEQIYIDENYCQSYIWQGNDDIILLVHGWESNASRWKKILPYLKKTGKTIVAIDAPAHGQSSGNEFNVPKYVKFITELTKKYNPKIIIGHSIGGFASLYYQYLNQNPSTEKIILLGAPSDLELMLNNYCKLLSLNSNVKKSLFQLSERIVNMPVDDFSGKNFAKKTTTKGLIIHDKNDFVVSINESKKIHSNWENSKFFETTGFGHSLNDKTVFEEIVRFIEL